MKSPGFDGKPFLVASSKKKLKAPVFSQKTLDFISTASRQKKVEWLEKNREAYEEHLLAPLQHLARTAVDALSKEAQGYHFPQKGIGRIKRSKNRVDENNGPFKDWISYSASRPHESRFESNPNLYFSIDPSDEDGDSVLVAGGFYVPSSRQLRSIREAIANDATPFEKLFASKAFSSAFKGGFSKDRISSRNPRGFDPNHPKMNWLKLQAFFVWKPYTKKQYTSPKFAEQVVSDWRQIVRLNHLLEEAIRHPGQKKPSAPAKEKSIASNIDDISVVERKYDF